jgi:hypothetical protein
VVSARRKYFPASRMSVVAGTVMSALEDRLVFAPIPGASARTAASVCKRDSCQKAAITHVALRASMLYSRYTTYGSAFPHGTSF